MSATDGGLTAEEKFSEKIRECIECGNTVIVSENPFNPTGKHDAVYCPCEPYGVPMVRREPEPGREPEPPGPLEQAGAMFDRWDDLFVVVPGRARAYCFDCGFDKRVTGRGSLSARTRANRALAGHRNTGCEHTVVITPRREASR